MPPSIKQELIELLLTEPVSSREITNQGNYVEVINRARPQGFAEKFALLLEETPTIHSPLEPEFFLHFFLGSVLTLPNTELMSKLNIEEILFKLDKIDKENYKSVKLVFKIREQNHYQLKFIIINTSSDTENIGFTVEELAEIRSKMGKLEVFSVNGQILHIVKDKGFKLKVLDEQSHKSFGISSCSSANSNFVQVKKDIVESIKINEAEDKILKNFEPLLDHLSDNVLSKVQQGAKESFALLKKVYQDYAELGTSESAYHGFIYGFFRLNYKYKYALDCYVERIAGKGYADIMLLSRKVSDNKDKVKGDDNNKGLEDVVNNKNQNTKDQDQKQFIPVIVEVKARTGADIAIDQINKSGYIYNLPNIRTNAKEAVIVGIDFNTKDTKAKSENISNNRVVNELMVKSTEIKKFENSLLSQLVQDSVQSQPNIESITQHIQDHVQHLYYSSIRSKDHHYLSRVLLGEVFTLKNDAIKRHIFIYDKKGQLDPIGDKVTTIILQQDSTAKVIILNIIEGSYDHQTRFRNNNQDRIFDQNKIIPVKQLGIKDVVIVNIAVNPSAEAFSNYISSDAIKVTAKTFDQFINAKEYQGKLQEIKTISVGDIINSIYARNIALGSETDMEDMPPSSKKRKLGGNTQETAVDIKQLLSSALLPVQGFISHESDLQALMHGLFVGQRYGEQRIKVFSEIIYGSGRADIVLFFSDVASAIEGKPIIFELKYCGLSQLKLYKNTVLESKLQLVNYINYFKSSSDYKEVEAVSIIYKKAATKDSNGNFLDVKKFTDKIDHTSHSSSAGDGKIANINYRQEAKISVVDPILSENAEYKILDFSNYHLRDNDYKKLVRFLASIRLELAGLSSIKLSRNDITDDKLQLFSEMLSNNVFINELDLSNNEISNAGIKSLIRALVDKEHIRVLEKKSFSEHKVIEQILHSNNNKYYLTSLDLSNNKFNSEGAAFLGLGLSILDGLEQLKLANNDIGDNGLISILQNLKYNYALQVLDLSGIKCGIIGAENLASMIRDKTSIVELHFADNNIGLRGMSSIISTLSEKSRIKILNLAGNNREYVTTSLDSLSEFISQNSNLKSLNFADNAIGDAGLNSLVNALTKHPGITDLDLSRNMISDCNDLFESLKENRIVKLILRDNRIKDIAKLISSLSEHSKLEYLDLANNMISTQDGAALLKSLIDQQVMISHLDVSGIDLKIADHLGQRVILKNLVSLIKEHKHLSYLGLSRCSIDDDVAKEIFAALELNSNLEVLDLSHNKIVIQDESIISGHPTSLVGHDGRKDKSGFLIYQDKLEELNLADNNIADKGGKILIKALAERGSEAVLKAREARDAGLYLNLDLSHNKFTQEFTKYLSEKLPELPLESLNLGSNQFDNIQTNQLINAVYDNRNIKQLSLDGNYVSHDDQQRLNNYLVRNKVTQIVEIDDLADKPYLASSIVSACLPSTSRHKREINECKIGWGDVGEISNMQTRNNDELVIDSKKFLEYSKQHIEDEVKSLQLVRLAEEVWSKGDGKIVGKYQGLLEQVIQDKSYKNYLQQERINAIGHHVINRDSYSISPELKLKLINAAGKIQLIRGVHGLVVSCQEGIRGDCTLSVSGLGYSFLSQPIENMMVKVAPKMVGNAVDVTSKLAPKVLSYDTKFVVQILGGRYATKLAKGGAGAIASIFDIVDIGIASNALIECNKRADSNNVCSAKDIRDNIAVISFASVSFVSAIALTAMGAGPAAVGVGLIIMVGQGIYNGISNIIEYEEKYDTTHTENWHIFWRTFLLQKMPKDIEHLVARDKTINDITEDAWQILSNSKEYIVAYAIGLGKEKVKYFQKCIKKLAYAAGGPYPYQSCSEYSSYNIEAAYSKIDMSNRTADTSKLSRVLPKVIANATMICLPKITEADYEKGLVQSRADAIYECDNAVVMVHNQRQSSLPMKNKYIVYDLRYVNSGSIIGSNVSNNIFQIVQGEVQIFGSSNLKNIFNINGKYHGKIYLSDNSTNIIDVSNLSDDLISMEYTHIYPLTMNMSIVSANSRSQLYGRSKDLKIMYIGRSNKVDKIVCKQFLYNRDGNIVDDNIEHNNIIIDSNGGIDSINKDMIQNCSTLIVSPNTQVQGGHGNHTIYIKSYSERNATSWIDVLGRATIIFPELSLLQDIIMEYLVNYNAIYITIPVKQNIKYNLVLKNYLRKDNSTHYVLIDKYGSNIIPRLDRIKADDIVKDFEIYGSATGVNITADVNYYKNISHTNYDYNIFGTLNNRDNNLLKFGSIGHDIIKVDSNTIYVTGVNGNDIYIISDSSRYNKLYINNAAEDLALDILSIGSVIKDLTVTKTNLSLQLNLVLQLKVTIVDYFVSKEYQHIALMDVDNNLYIPFDLEEEMRLVPFCHKSFSKNVCIFTNNVGHAVIDIDKDNIVLYQQGSDLLITEQKADSVNIILKDYYQDKQQWLDMKLYGYNNATISIIDLHNIEITVISYQEQYNSVIEEYVVDLSKKSEFISHNQNFYGNNHSSLMLPPILVEQSKEKIGVVIFKNTPLKRLVVYDLADPVFQDKLYNNSLIVGNWSNNLKYQISMFEFDNGLEQERIYVSNKTIARMKLSNSIDRDIDKINNNIVKALIDYLKLSCSRYNEQNILTEKLRYNFLEKELNYRVGDSNNQSSNLKEIRKYLNNANNIAGEAFMWLVVKSYNELLLKHPYIEESDLHKIDDSCFGTVLAHLQFTKIIEHLNANLSFSGIKQYVNDNKQDVQKIIELLLTSDLNNHHKHRHHHGEHYHREAHHNKNITVHHRGRRDIEDRLLKISEESNDDDIVLSSSSSLKPLGYNIINWLRDKFNSLNLNPVKQIKDWFNVDDVKEQSKIDWDFVDNLSYQDNNVCELNADYASGSKLLGGRYKVEQRSTRLIGHEESTIINGINFNLLDKQGSLLLVDLLIRLKSGIKYNNKEAILVNNNDEYARYAHSLAYSSYTNVEESQEELELLGIN